jgi:cytochrome c556
MKKTAGLLLACAVAAAVMAQESPFQAVGTMSQLMVNIVYPTSNAIFYIARGAPKNQVEWDQMANNALTLAESGNLLMMPARARDNGKWMTDAKLLVDVGAAAYKAAQAKDADGLMALSDQLNTACVQCHQDFRPNYRKKK